MKQWLVLAAAIALEVTATLALRAAVDDPWWSVLTVVGYAGAFVALSVLLRLGAPIGVVYGIWAAAGVALTAVLASVVFGEPLTPTIGIGIVLVIAGIALVETGHGVTAVEQAPDAAERTGRADAARPTEETR